MRINLYLFVALILVLASIMFADAARAQTRAGLESQIAELERRLEQRTRELLRTKRELEKAKRQIASTQAASQQAEKKVAQAEQDAKVALREAEQAEKKAKQVSREAQLAREEIREVWAMYKAREPLEWPTLKLISISRPVLGVIINLGRAS